MGSTSAEILCSVSENADFMAAMCAVETAAGEWADAETRHGEDMLGVRALRANWQAAQTRLVAVVDAIVAQRVARAAGVRCSEV